MKSAGTSRSRFSTRLKTPADTKNGRKLDTNVANGTWSDCVFADFIGSSHTPPLPARLADRDTRDARRHAAGSASGVCFRGVGLALALAFAIRGN
jgi:hypothetical protein